MRKKFLLQGFVLLNSLLSFQPSGFGKEMGQPSGHSSPRLSIEDLAYDCETEILAKEINGSCFLVGVIALKAKNLTLHKKIEAMCVQYLQENMGLRPEYFERWMSYFPKCSYIYRSKLKKRDNSFDARAEIKTLVRFLNM